MTERDADKQEEIKQVKEWIFKLEERLALLEADFDHANGEWEPPYNSPVKPKTYKTPKPKTIWTAGPQWDEPIDRP